jgi:hypothetical protein
LNKSAISNSVISFAFVSHCKGYSQPLCSQDIERPRTNLPFRLIVKG